MKNIMLMTAAFCAITAGAFTNEVDGIFQYKVGQFEVYMLVESERDGNTGILVGADEAVLRRFIPTTGFRHTANAFLVRTPTQNILIDFGTGANGILLEKIRRIGVEPETIDTVLITHLHMDHFGGLQRDGEAVFPNAVIYLSVRELEHFTLTNPNQAAINTLELYKSQVETFEPGALYSNQLREIVPGITPIAAYGHTPGHTIFQIENGEDKLLIIGDLLHVALVQFPIPDISATFDIDPIAAAHTRLRVLSYAAMRKIPVGGMHIVNPGIGHVETDGIGFRFSPLK